MGMEMELKQGEIQAHCTDISDGALALVRSVLSIRSISILKGGFEFITDTPEQYNSLNNIIDEVMTTFTDYYYAASEENYLEHPYYQVTLYEGEELKDYHKNYFDNNPLFKVEYERLSDTTNRIAFSVKDKDKCLQALDDYCSKYGYDELWNDEANMLTCEAQDKQLYNLLTEKDYNLNNFVITDIKYIKALCYNEYKEKLSIANATIGIDENNKPVFRCTIADEGFVEGYGKDDNVEDVKAEAKAKADKPKKVRKHFSPSVQDLYNYIKTYAQARDYQIYPYELIGEKPEKLYENMGMLTTMVNRLNEQYREIIQDETAFIMKYDKTLECYMIKDIWNN